MKQQFTAILALLCILSSYSQVNIPSYYQQDKGLSKEIESIIEHLDLSGTYDAAEDGMEPLSLVIIDLNAKQPKIGGVHMENFIYPASVYKMYVAMEVLYQIEQGKHALDDPYYVKAPNDVDTAKEIFNDPRPLLRDGDTVTVGYLLDLMISRSDNSAANCLIDLAGRDQINHSMHKNEWQGSEVTRKFLARQYEDPAYKDANGTETCALHAADFMYKIEQNQLISPWVSMQLKRLLGAQLDNAKLAPGLPDNAMFYHKTGWWSMYTHDVGIVDDGKVRYIISLFTPLPEDQAMPKMKAIASAVHQLMKQRYRL